LDGKGAVLLKQDNYAQAIQYFDRVLAIDPNDELALDGKQIALSKLGPNNSGSADGSNTGGFENSQNNGAAETSRPAAPRPSSADVSALDNNGAYLFILGKNAQALEYFEQALTINPRDKVALTDIGLVYSKQRDYIQAIEYFNKALAIDPNYSTALLGKAITFSKMGHHNN
jgi:tetratricopeptide (TPR) repeat protein